MTLFRRSAKASVLAALSDTPVVVLNGARQVGKTTLTRAVDLRGSSVFLSLDDPASRSFAEADPRGFVDRGVDTLVIDEVQLEPRLFRAIKASVDLDRRPGRFLLTGSSRLLSAPDMADSLVGRVETIDLWPLTQNEIDSQPETFLERVISEPESMLSVVGETRDVVLRRLCRGGFPEVIGRQPDRRVRWFSSYVRTTVEKVVRELAALERVAEIPRLLQLCAARTGQEVNVAEISNQLGMPARTGSAYLARLAEAFLIQLVPAWSTNLSAKVVRRPKLAIVDAGLAAHLIQQTPASLIGMPTTLGPLLETFVTNELRSQIANSGSLFSLSHFRDRSGAEVDLVLERPDGAVIAIEVKATSSPEPSDFKGLRFLQERLGSRMLVGVLLTLAPEPQRLGESFYALPVSSLWSSEAGASTVESPT
jgi:uncharacterized protein